MIRKQLNAVLMRVFLGLFYITYALASYGGSHPTPAEQFYNKLSVEQQQWLTSHPIIRIAAMNNWPPFNFTNNGVPDGIGADYVHALNQRLGDRLSLSSGPWSEIYTGVAERRLDALMDITEKPDRTDLFEFTSTYLEIPHVIAARGTKPYFRDENDLVGKTVALERGFGNITDIKANYPNISILVFANTSEALGAVVRGEADAYVGNRSVVIDIINKELIKGVFLHGRAQQSSSKLAIGVRNDWPVLADILNLALKDITPAEKAAIQSHWVGTQTGGPKHEALSLTSKERQWLQQHPVIKLASDASWPPFEYFDKSGNYLGIAADYMQLLQKKLGVRFELSPIAPWSKIVESLKARELDVFSLAMKTPERQKFARFTKPYVSNSVVIVTQENIRYVAGLEGLKGRRIALEKGYALVDFLKADYPDLELTEYSTTLDALQAVDQGEAFAYLGNIAATSFQIRESALTELVISGEIPYRYELAMGVRSDWPELVSILDKALASISVEERSDIYSRWVQVSVNQGLPLGWLLAFLGIASVIVIVVVYWNYQLNKKVVDRTRELEHRALHDPLTDLPNRISILAQMERMIAVAERNQCLLAVLFLDLDDFKKINDTQGHRVGDQLLLAVALRLRETLRKSDIIGRLGGDEFVIVIDQVNSASEVALIAQHLIRKMVDGFSLKNQSLIMTASIGIATYPSDGNSAHDLLEHADTAMYHAKKQGGNDISFFNSEMNKIQQRKINIEHQMIGALSRNELYLAYQPIIDLASDRPKGFEALLRWNNKDIGMIAPDEFIPIAEQNGFILQLGEFVLEQALADACALQQQYQLSLTMSVNLSPRQFRDKNLLKRVRSKLTQYQLTTGTLIFEITEGVLLSHEQQSEQVLQELQAIGIPMSMDDFGTGYSSLSYIRNYPFNSLKIDREFVRDMATDQKDKQLVEATVAMADSLRMDVVAEGVETAAQYALLKSIGCQYAQGYHMGKPMPFNELVIWLDGAIASSCSPAD